TEVTVGQWKKFADSGYLTDGEKQGGVVAPDPETGKWGLVKGACWRNPSFGFSMVNNHPACCISWNDAVAFCRWLTETEKKAGKLPAGMEYRLPTEAEWEYACRAGTQTKFWWGDKLSVGKDRINTGDKNFGFPYISPVDIFGAKGRNGFGLADMLGNVWEWCSDVFDPKQDNPDAQSRLDAYSLRGGSFHNARGYLRCAARYRKGQSHCLPFLGMRACCGVPGGSGQPGPNTASPVATAPPAAAVVTSVSPAAPPSQPPGMLRPPTATPPTVGAQTNASLVASTGMELVWIPPGEFMLGSTPEEQEWAIANGSYPAWTRFEGERPRRTVIKEGFWLGRTEVTVGQWKQFVAATGYITQGESAGVSMAPQGPGMPWDNVRGVSWKDPNFGFPLKDNHPVVCISWNDATAFCEWLTESGRKANKLPAGKTYRLPTEAEWEYACRGGTQTMFWWDDRRVHGERRVNWSGKGDGFEFVSPVDHYGTRGRNKFGLTDMIGNAWEWCLDAYDTAGAHGEYFAGTDSPDRVLRGASFQRGAPCYIRCAHRMLSKASISNSSYGFRVCCGIPGGSGQSLDAMPVATKTTPDAKTEEKKPAVAGVADSEMQKDARKFARNQSSIKGLYVVRTDAGLRVGGAQDIIATIERVSSDRETICDFVSDVAKDTQISMEEAQRLLKVRHPVWQAGCKIRFSYSNKYSKQAGGSAGGAFSVLLLSLLDGVQIDPGFAMTGDVTVDGKIREVGAVAEKLRGALLDKCRIVAIPEANEENLNDLAVLYSPAMLWSMQILSIATLDDAAGVARTDRAPNLAKAMDLFGQVQRSLPTSATVYALRNPAVVQTLRQVLQLAPNHSSAEYMLRVANNQLPATLSLGGSLDEIWAAPGPLLGFLFADYKAPEKSKRYYFEKVPSGAFKAAMDRLSWLQFRLHPKTRELKAAMVDYMISLDQLHRQSAFSSGTLRLHLTKRDKVLSEAHLLGTDRKTLEEMMH
ncbi:MAG: SUMF1/EgtB/PvdO family nonheme iron enzyme, partial [Verrucomicrobiia bacterium]